MGIRDIFELDKKEGTVIFLRPREGADAMFKKDRRVRVLEDDVYGGYVHAQSVCDVMSDGASQARQWFRNNDTKALMAEVEKDLAQTTGTGVRILTPIPTAVGIPTANTNAVGMADDFARPSIQPVITIEGSGPRSGSWIHPKLLVPFLMWVDKRFAIKAFDWVGRILAGDLTLCAEIAKRHDQLEGTVTTATFRTTPVAVEPWVPELETAAKVAETRLRIEQAESARRVLVESTRTLQLTSMIAQQKLIAENAAVLRVSGRDRLLLQDRINDLLLTDQVSGRVDSEVGATVRKGLDVTTVARDMGYRLDAAEASRVGRRMATKFRAAFPGVDIPKADRFVNGEVRPVNWYEDTPRHREMMESAIRELVDETGKRPAVRRVM